MYSRSYLIALQVANDAQQAFLLDTILSLYLGLPALKALHTV
jgi:hypothetical protein